MALSSIKLHSTLNCHLPISSGKAPDDCLPNFFDHSYTALTPREHFFQQFGLHATKALAVLLHNSFHNIVRIKSIAGPPVRLWKIAGAATVACFLFLHAPCMCVYYKGQPDGQQSRHAYVTVMSWFLKPVYTRSSRFGWYVLARI